MPSSGDPGASGEARTFSLERLVFFTDAVFAIAITLLVIDLRLPALPAHPSAADFTRAVLALTPRLFSYALSFAIIAQFWLGHWHRFEYIHTASDGLAVINLLLLGLVALIPFPTAVLGEHGDQPGAVILYAVVVASAGVVGSVSWLYAWHSGLVVPGHSRRWVYLLALRGLVAPIVLLASLPLLAIHPYVVEAAWVVILPLQWLVARRARRIEATP